MDDKEREELIAFLDGEVDEETAQAYEARITVDPKMRAEADAFKQAWDMLDYLPRPEPSPNFTNRTLDRLTLRESMSGLQLRQSGHVRSWMRITAWLSAFLLSIGVGLGAAFLLSPVLPFSTESANNMSSFTDKHFLSDMRIAKYRPLYEQVESLAFAEKLAELNWQFRKTSITPTPDKKGEKQQIDAGELAYWRDQVTSLRELPVDQLQHLRQLDAGLHALPPMRTRHLLDVMNRYQSWLERLPEHSREKVSNAKTVADRMQTIRTIREEQWLESQPCSFQAKLAQTEGEAQQKQLIQQRKRQENLHQAYWKVAENHWDNFRFRPQKNPSPYDIFRPVKQQPYPCNLDDIPTDGKVDVKGYVKNYLLRVISPEERQALEDAEREPWPAFAFALVCLADKYPPALNHGEGPSFIKELPRNLQQSIMRGKWIDRRKLLQFEGDWPGFPMYVTKKLSEQKLSLPPDVWPTHKNDLSFPVRELLEDKLQPLLTKKEERQLNEAQGHWPDYPETISALADKYYLQIPWRTLPGKRDRWDTYRVGYNPFLEE